MEISSEGKAFIKSFEGLRLSAYRDSAGVWTIGYGSTRHHDDKAVKPGDRLANEQQADALLTNTIGQYETAVNKNVKVALTQHQFDALVSITYNVGTGIMLSSTLVKKLNVGDMAGAADQFLLWNKITDPATNKKMPCDTLTQRRKKERQLFLKTS